MDEIIQRLTEISIRQQQITKHLVAQQGQTEQDLGTLHTTSARRIPLLDPRAQVTQILPKMTAHDDVEAFPQMFENTAVRAGWESEDWARLLVPLLTGEAQRAYFALSSVVSDTYSELKKKILACLGLSPVCAAQYFHDWVYKPRLPARAQATELFRLAQHWLLDGEPTAAFRALPRTHRQEIGMRNPTTVAELVEAVELAEAAQHRDAGKRAPPFPRRVVQE